MARDAFLLKNGLDIADEVGLSLRACHSERKSKKQKSHTTLFYIHGLVERAWREKKVGTKTVAEALTLVVGWQEKGKYRASLRTESGSFETGCMRPLNSEVAL